MTERTKSNLNLVMVAALICVTLAPAPTFAKTATQKQAGTAGQPTPIGKTYGKWRTYKVDDAGQPVCYMALTTGFAKSKKFKRSESHLLITQRPEEKSKDVVSYTAGYTYKPATDVLVQIGKQSFNMFTAKDTAWSRDAAADKALTAAIISTKIITITGTPGQKNTAPTHDRLDVTGANEAYHAINQACGLEASPAKKAVSKPQKAKKQGK
ncbi:MAG: hypothetical protein JO126_08910 [Alphaproteobacteria bacterium]|nr:hypothetical protein [Alphaproteobacteria bacterium]MBV8549561.1 hypothetical protein [Alphaproteobacteria bacterium]